MAMKIMFSEIIKRHKLFLVFLGDIAIFLLSIVAILFIRYGSEGFSTQFLVHRDPFIVILIIWFLIFYISNLYTYKAFSNILEIARHLTTTILVSFFITITIFYIFSRFFSLTPKANLVMFTFTFGLLDLAWRYLLRKVFIQKVHRSNILMLANSPLVKEVADHVKTHPQLGYSLYIFNTDINGLGEIIQKNSINLIIINGQSLKNKTVARTLYSLLPKQVEVLMLTDFYETLFNCIPLSEIEEEWFIREITENKNIYESAKRAIEIISVSLSLIIAIPLSVIIGFLVAITSKGPVIYRQERTGKGNKTFILYKFRTMKINQEGPLWTALGDTRVTFIGKILRHTHLDEMPQLWNVLKGDISLIGPRPECTKLVEMYSQIPYYEIRHTIKPGIIGWAQLNYQPSTSIAEAQKKFQFDLYYLKNRSFILDLFIILKTIRKFF
jgi:exopolysaccharide biosynthesis polyprenyl glycosylphosphotransferase